MVELTIDGIPTTVPREMTVLEAARSLGIVIPTLCCDPGLTPYGACRLCMVEVVKGNRSSLEASCTLPALDGQVIITNSERVMHPLRTLCEILQGADAVWRDRIRRTRDIAQSCHSIRGHARRMSELRRMRMDMPGLRARMHGGQPHQRPVRRVPKPRTSGDVHGVHRLLRERRSERLQGLLGKAKNPEYF
jgi:ferredoxin